MKVGDLIRVKQMSWMDYPGYFLYILECKPDGGVVFMIVSGPHFGREHVAYWGSDRREFEVISESG